ncbi:MAG: hypothetical protein ACTSYI_06675 [Promethearchaeota archaeon]
MSLSNYRQDALANSPFLNGEQIVRLLHVMRETNSHRAEFPQEKFRSYPLRMAFPLKFKGIHSNSSDRSN